ncbi:MAG: trypsin-like peptidase domain-containing protein [Polyangiaceae bacterium]
MPVNRLLPLAVLVSALGVGALARADSSESAPAGRGAGPNRGGATASAARLYDHVRESVVLLERSGLPPAVGTVLSGDGRILTSLSALRGAELLSVRYSDGTTVRATVADADPVADLALLQPEAGRGGVWLEGLTAGETDPVGAPLRVMHPAPGMRVGAAEAVVRRRVDVFGRDGQSLPGRLEVDVPVPGVSGAPLVDRHGGVVGLLTRACAGPRASEPGPAPQGGGAPEAAMGADGACRPVLVGAPVQALRAFLLRPGTRAVPSQSLRDGPPAAPASAGEPEGGRETPSSSMAGRSVAARTSAPPWLGIRGEAADKAAGVRGVRVVAVAPSSPAEKAGLRAGVDVIASVDGQPVEAPEKLAEIIASRAAGDTIRLLVLSESELRSIQVVLTRQE